jgi:hypothetical protein
LSSNPDQKVFWVHSNCWVEYRTLVPIEAETEAEAIKTFTANMQNEHVKDLKILGVSLDPEEFMEPEFQEIKNEEEDPDNKRTVH